VNSTYETKEMTNDNDARYYLATPAKETRTPRLRGTNAKEICSLRNLRDSTAYDLHDMGCARRARSRLKRRSPTPPRRWAPTISRALSIRTATEFALGQAFTPAMAWPGFADKFYTRTINYEMPGWRIDRVLDTVPPDRKGGGLPPGPTQTVIINEYSLAQLTRPLDDSIRLAPGGDE
jgi:hypothetical protein